MIIPDDFSRKINEILEQKGQQWLDQLPAIVDNCAQKWGLVVGTHLPDLSYNYIAPATRQDGTQVILKVCIPGPEMLTELEALRYYDGRGAVKLLDADIQLGVLMMERLIPGTHLSSLSDDDEATLIAADIMKQLWRPAPAQHNLPSVADWASGLSRLRKQFDGGTGPLPEPLVSKAEQLFDELIGSMASSVLLHGDLHHYNILSAGPGRWAAIDPKGVIGEPAYETARFLHNPWPDLLHRTNPGKVMDRRIEIFSEVLGLERSRLIGWGFCKTILSAWWCIEDGGDGWEYPIACARLLDKLIW